MSDPTPILDFRNITKTYPGVTALDDVSFCIYPGQVHCLLGENGAGKSTLIKILAGAIQPDRGEILLKGQPIGRITNPQHAQNLGLSFIFQELNVIDQLTVGDNFSLGRENSRFGGILNRNKDNNLAQKFLNDLGMDIDPRTPMSQLSVAQKQMVEIARSLAVNASIIVMDEPSAPLTEHELGRLFEIIERITNEQGVTIIYVSHILSEVFQIGHTYTVLRDGAHIATGALSETDTNGIIHKMVGRELKRNITRTPNHVGEPVLSLENVSYQNKLHDISFNLHAGEIVGVAGLAGNGQSELAGVIFGKFVADKGEIVYEGDSARIRTPRQAIKRSLGLIPEERRSQGIVGGMSVRGNISLASPDKVSTFGIVQKRKDDAIAQEYVESLSIKTPGTQQLVQNLSGGNQQKCVVARWLASESRILILEEPTRGIDVGAKAEIYAIMDDLARQGVAQLMFSSEMDELLGLCNRILVMHQGRLVADLPRNEATQEKIVAYASAAEYSEITPQI